MEENSKTNRRRRIIVDRKFQFYYFMIWCLTGLGMVTVSVVFYFLLFRPFLGNVSSAIMIRVVIGIGVFILLFCVLMGLMSLVMTHKVAGAAYRVNKNLAEWLDGKFGDDIQLRKHDYLQTLSRNMNRLRAALKERAEAAEELAKKLEEFRTRAGGSLGEEDGKALEDLISQVRGLSVKIAPGEIEQKPLG